MALFFGCGGGSGTDEGATTGTTPPATTGASGSPGTSSSAGSGAGMFPGVMMSSVSCGTATCMGFMAGGFGAAACCVSEATSECGTMMGGTCMPKPAVADKCPMIPAFMGRAVNSCCRPDNTCGVDASAFGMGCGPYSGLAQIGITPPPATMCDGTPIAGAASGSAGSTAAAAGSSASAGGAGTTGAAAGGGAAGSSAAAAGSSASAGGAGKAAAGASGSATAGSGASSSGSAGRAGSSSTASAGAGGR